MAEVIVIGGGPGGYVSAIRAAQLGNNVKLVEKDSIGGTCLNRGCIPTKVLLHAVGLRDNFKKARDYGFTIQEQSFDWETLMQRKNDTVKQLTDGVRTLLDSWGVEVIGGEAFFEEPKVVSVRDDRGSSHRLSGDCFIIATGSRPSTPPIEGLESRGVLTSDEALDIEEIPSSMLIVGGGVIGIEFATLFSGLGCNVTVVEFLPRILSTIDEEMAYMVHEILSSKGISIHVAARVVKIEEKGSSLTVTFEDKNGKSTTVEVEKVLLAAGRTPNTEILGLERTGVNVERGRIVVDKHMRTNLPHIYAIGDCASPYMLAHVAMAEGETAAANIGGQDLEMDYTVVPSCIFTSPELASVGLSESECLKAGISVKTGRFPMAGNGRALTLGEAEGVIKIVADSRYERVLGVHILGPNATELISTACMAMKLEATAEEISDMIFAHPTIGEALKEAALSLQGRTIHLPKG